MVIELSGFSFKAGVDWKSRLPDTSRADKVRSGEADGQLIRLDLTSAELSRSLTSWIAALSAAPTSFQKFLKFT